MDPSTGASTPATPPPRPRRNAVSRTLPMEYRRPARRRASSAEVAIAAPFAPAGRSPAMSWAKPIAPTFADRRFDVRDFGAIDDDRTDNTDAFARAIDACATAGGGQVLVPAGRWLCGPIELLDNIDLHVAAGATLRFVADPARYPHGVTLSHAGRRCAGHAPMIHACGRSNVAVTGSGTLLGAGAAWWPWAAEEMKLAAALHAIAPAADPGGNAGHVRPPLLAFIDCQHVAVAGITVRGAGPACTVRLTACTHASLRDIRLIVGDGPDNGGVVLEDCRDARVERCEIDSAGHGICLSGGAGETARIVLRDVRLCSGHGDGVAICNDGDVCDVKVQGVRIVDARHGVSLRASRGWGGVVERLEVEDVTIDHARGAAIYACTEPAPYASDRATGAAPTFRHLTFRRIACARAAQAVTLNGLPEHCIQRVELHGVEICSDEGLTCVSARQLSLRDVRITPAFGPDLSLRDVRDVQIEGIRHDRPDATFLDLRGRRTGGIRIRSEPGARVRPSIALGADVPRDAIEHV